MPGFVKTPEDERLWAKAKARAKEEGHDEDWAYVTGIFKKMKGGHTAARQVALIARVASRFAGDQSALGHLKALLTGLRKLYWVHWTAHWMSSGPNSNSDHLLFQRLYEALDEEIDGLAEKIVSDYGSPAVAVTEGTEALAQATAAWDDHADPMHLKCLWAEEGFQRDLEMAYATLKAIGLRPGLDNFLQGIADQHETHIYLLRRRAA